MITPLQEHAAKLIREETNPERRKYLKNLYHSVIYSASEPLTLEEQLNLSLPWTKSEAKP